MTYLLPVEIPDLEPLRQSFEYDQLESELKEAFFAVFEKMIRPAERQLNLYGMPHLGGDELIERALKDAGMAIVRRNSVRSSFLLKAAKSRNPRRGMLFLARYLQSVWPNVWKIDQLWHPTEKLDQYPDLAVPPGVLDLGNGISGVLDGDGLGNLTRTTWQGEMPLYPMARRNALWSSNFQGDGWGKVNCTLTKEVTMAPDGTMTGAAMTSSAAGNTTLAQFIDDIAPGGKHYALSVYLKEGTAQGDVRLTLADGNAVPLASVVATPGPEWQQFLVEGMFPAGAAAYPSVWIDPVNDAIAAGETLHLWGAQLEHITAGMVAPTSLISTPENGPATVTDYTIDENGVAHFGDGVTPPVSVDYFRTSRVRITLPVTSDNGLGLEEVGKAFRPTLAARLLIELQLTLGLENTGLNGGVAFSCAAAGSAMPFMAIGTLS
ncbi:phage head spike fiber domain-containing protein [Cupriavidus pauculus]|uniref:phage head spike fiber domain-containing protein n=1 Tax=Cupriavidus pauculus TaxID=82633 RepID=UPI001D0CA22A|nr:hypothetical protein [Cupriavidus pauculus]